MSGDAQITGRIRIDPPITWPELAGKTWATEGYRHPSGYWSDAKVQVQHHDVDTDQGVMSIRHGVAIVPAGGETSAATVTESVGRIVEEFGTTPDGTPRTFVGWLHVIWGEGEAVYRVVVRDGRAVEVSPQVIWPEGARDEDGAE